MSPGADGGVHPDDLAHPAFDHLREGLARAEELRLADERPRNDLETQVWNAFDIPLAMRRPAFYAPALVRHNVEVARMFGFPHPRNVGAKALLPNRPVFPLRDRALPGRSVRRPASARLAVLAARRRRNA